MGKKYDLVIKSGEYQKDGETKTKWQNIGVVLEGENGPYILLDRTFNPAGLPNPENRNNILISMFEPKSKDENSPAPASQSGLQQPTPSDISDDDIPF